MTSKELKQHVNIHDKNKRSENALILSCKSDHLEIVQYLLTSDELKEHANPYDKDNSGNNALMWSCGYCHWNIAQYFIINQNMIIDKQMMNWLINHEKEEVLNMIQSRDLYHKMNNHLSDSDKMIKHRKI